MPTKPLDPILGVILLDDHPCFVSLELPWLNNQKQISCIPEGKYKTSIINTNPKITGGLGRALYLHDVPERSEILCHIANTAGDLRGCIGIGSKYEPNTFTILESGIAFRSFMSFISGKENELEIKRYRNE